MLSSRDGFAKACDGRSEVTLNIGFHDHAIGLLFVREPPFRRVTGTILGHEPAHWPSPTPRSYLVVAASCAIVHDATVNQYREPDLAFPTEWTEAASDGGARALMLGICRDRPEYR